MIFPFIDLDPTKVAKKLFDKTLSDFLTGVAFLFGQYAKHYSGEWFADDTDTKYWIEKNSSNAQWFQTLYTSCLDEYKHRFGVDHPTIEFSKEIFRLTDPNLFEKEDLTPYQVIRHGPNYFMQSTDTRASAMQKTIAVNSVLHAEDILTTDKKTPTLIEQESLYAQRGV